jgi:hypothetical protein
MFRFAHPVGSLDSEDTAKCTRHVSQPSQFSFTFKELENFIVMLEAV